MAKNLSQLNPLKTMRLRKKFIHELSIARQEKQRCMFIFNSPTHGNLGDHAISMAQRQLLSAYADRFAFIEVETAMMPCLKKQIKAALKAGDIVMINGGGFIGTLWEHEHNSVLAVLEIAKDFPVIIFPQTVYFQKNEQGELAACKFRDSITACKNIRFFLRDKNSYRYMRALMPERKEIFLLSCDMVTFLDLPTQEHSRENVLFCLRGDKEKLPSITMQLTEKIKAHLLDKGFRVDRADTVLSRPISKPKRAQAVIAELNLFKRYRLIVTDRLHGMLFAIITDSPCLALDNLSGKVFGAYENSFRKVPFVRCIKSDISASVDELIDSLLHLDFDKFNRSAYLDYYDEICKVIDRNI